MINILRHESDGNMMKCISPNPLMEIEQTVDTAYEMAKRGSIKSAIDTIETAHKKYNSINQSSPSRHVVMFYGQVMTM